MIKSGMKYKTSWKSGIYCPMGKKEFFPKVVIEIWHKNIPFEDLNDLMSHFEGTFEDACEYLLKEIRREFNLSCRIRIEIGDDYFSGFAEEE